MKAGELASANVATITVDETLSKAAHRMRRDHVGDLVVVESDGTSRRPVGIITDRDLVMALDRVGAETFEQTSVGSAMSESLILAKKGEPVHEVLQNMRDNGVRRVPVIDIDDDLVGILTLDDLLGYYGDGVMTMVELVQAEISREVAGE
ncbi:MAG: CBS domain-containing protein [Bradymonadaceae bacterium]